MEGLAPPLELLLSVKNSLECGESVRMAIMKFVSTHQTEFSQVVSRWLFALDQNGEHKAIVSEIESPYRQGLLKILEQGLRGQSILLVLREFEEEINDACARELEQFMALLPIKLLVPLLLFQFPAYLILLLGPLIKNFMGAF